MTPARQRPGSTAAPHVERAPFGALPDGGLVELFTLHAGTLTLRVIDYGGIIVSLDAPDSEGRCGDVVLGHDTLDGYLHRSPYFGAIIGRCANRIAHGRFALDGVIYQLATNDGVNHLHGGMRGFDKQQWDVTPFIEGDAAGLTLRYVSPAGDEGYPGRLLVKVCYRLSVAGELIIDYRATTDAPTIVNLTQHSYFNLAAGASLDVLDHELTIAADSFTPVDATLIPTGELREVADTPFDFRAPRRIGEFVDARAEQLVLAGGYDHNFVLSGEADSQGLRHAARLLEPISGRTLDVRTSEPGLQLYSGNFLDGTIRGKGGRLYGCRAGLCLETQHFPDAPNHPSFPSIVLRPGEKYQSRTVFTFGARAAHAGE